MMVTGSAHLCQACGSHLVEVEQPGWIKLCARCAGPDPLLPFVPDAACPACGGTVIVWSDVHELNCCSCSHMWLVAAVGS